MDERMRSQYAETLWNLNAKEQAIEHMEFAVRLSGGNPNLLVRLGDMYLEQGQLELAYEQADQAILANRQLACAWALRGDVLRKQGNVDGSLAAYHRALSITRHFPRVQFAIAEAYNQQARYNRALATLRKLADGYPPGDAPAKVHYLQGMAQRELGRYDDAIASFTTAQRAQPSAETCYQLAATRLMKGDAANARVSINDALALRPDHGPSLALLSQIESSQQRTAALRPGHYQ
jgi:tetratricopeptide (TPR) repeat protein